MLHRAALPLVLSILISSAAHAGMTFSLAAFSAGPVELEGIELAVEDSADAGQRLQLRAAKIKLPPPFDVLSFLELHCPRFTYTDTGLSCTGGTAQIVSPWLDSGTVEIDFRVAQQQSFLKLKRLKIAGGTLQLAVTSANEAWQAEFSAAAIKAQALQRITALQSFPASRGKIDIKAQAHGRGSDAGDFAASLTVTQLDAQSADGKYATEKLHANAKLNGKIAAGEWQWRQRIQINRGGLYIDPVYISADEHGLDLQGNGQWLPQSKQLRFADTVITHAGVAEAKGHALLYDGALQDAGLALHSDRLDKFHKIYLQPFLAATPWGNAGLEGSLHAQATFAIHELTRIDLRLPRFGIADSGQRIALNNGSGNLHWAKHKNGATSLLSWDSLQLYGLPIGKAALAFEVYAKTLHLAEPAGLPLVDGLLHIGRFDWRMGATQPEIDFQGAIERVSLDKLTDALHITPLSGQLSGTIPGVRFRDGKMAIGGALQLRLFDGLITIHDMRLSDLATGAPNLNADLEISNLDLQQITKRFAFGGMQGRLSGYVRDLQLQNWQPVTFFAWLGTPDGDNSIHRISQKAVNSIASIGGGGASDLLSRSMLRAFENFGYDRLGAGCYLHGGVCQMFGVEAAQQGFYIVKGGGLPRIDVIGYNSRIDWQILLQRLRRVLATDQAIIQ